MGTVKTLFSLIIALLVFINCTSCIDELSNMTRPTSRSTNTSSIFRFDPNYVATVLEGPYESADRYFMMNTGHYLVSDHFYLRCVIKNNSHESFTLSCN